MHQPLSHVPRSGILVTASVWAVQEVLKGAGSEIQLSAAASFLTILQDDIILIHTHTYSILKTVLLHLNHRDTGNHAGHTLVTPATQQVVVFINFHNWRDM